MGRKFTAAFKAVATTAQVDFFEILAPSDAVVKILEWELSQNTEVGDAQEEQLALTTNRGIGAVTSGSGGSTATAQPIEDGDAAFGGTVEINNTTKMAAGSGTLEELEPYSWNVRQPLRQVYVPSTEPVISPGNRWTLELETTPADSITINGRVILEEIGG